MATLFFDCFSGISGDMTVGALRDLGVEERVFQDALANLGLEGEFEARFQLGDRQGISGWKFEVNVLPRFHLPAQPPPLLAPTPAAHTHTHTHTHTHSHTHTHTHGRSFREIKILLADSALSPFVKARSVAVFRRIAEAEGRIHGQPPDEVAFHEVGAVDSLVDIVAACAGLEALDAATIFASPLVEGSGWVDCAHGRFPLPAPATLEILKGIPLQQIADRYELITPTGAALLAEFASDFGPFPEMRITRTGYGLGTRNTAPRPNVLRAILGERVGNLDAETDEILQLECNLDDMSSELAGAAMEDLFAAGALDVFFTPAQMKKNRPGFVLSVLATEESSTALARILLTQTSAFGLRMHRRRRLKLRREFRELPTPHGSIKVKLGYLGAELVQAAPEYDSCRALAKKTGLTLREIYLVAQRELPPISASRG